MELISKYYKSLDNRQKQQLEDLEPLYEEWNARINVISRKDMDKFYERHVLHSLGLSKVLEFKPSTRVLDVGTGGGFPGIPLAILYPEVDFHLVDSIGKKIKVVNEISASLGLKNVKATQIRAEKVKGKYDFVVSRAVTRMKPFLQWISNKISEKSFNDLDNGVLYLKGGDLEEEMAEVKRSYQVYELQDYFKEEFFETKKIIYLPI